MLDCWLAIFIPWKTESNLAFQAGDGPAQQARVVDSVEKVVVQAVPATEVEPIAVLGKEDY